MEHHDLQKGGVAVVTGAGGGIGAPVALGLAESGFAVVLAGRREAPLAGLAARIRRGGGTCRAVPTDVSVPPEVAALFRTVDEEFGRVDLLFNNAGVSPPPRRIDDIPLEEWQQALAINVTGVLLCAQHAARLMASQEPRGGRIINNGSLAAHVPRRHSAAYTATKHAVLGLTKAMALDLRDLNICCSQIDIGNARTPLIEDVASGSLQADGRSVAEPLIDVENVVRAVLLMATLPLDTNVLSLTVLANAMPYVGRG